VSAPQPDATDCLGDVAQALVRVPQRGRLPVGEGPTRTVDG